MIRRIVLLRRHEPLEDAWTKRSFSVAAAHVEKAVSVKGVSFDNAYHPVRVLGKSGFAFAPSKALGFDYRKMSTQVSELTNVTFSLRADFDDEDAIARLRVDRKEEVAGVFSDPRITTFPAPYCGSNAVGTYRDVARKLGARTLRKAKLTGKNVRVAVVDTGIDGSKVRVVGGWSPNPGYQPGTTPPDHGTMVGFDVRIAAPDARILDYALLQSTGNTWTAFLSDAIAAFANLIDLLRSQPGHWW